MQHGDIVRWSDTEYLLAAIVDVLAWANWQRGQGKGPKPKPIRRPTDKDPKLKSTSLPVEEARAKLYELTGITRKAS